MSLKPKIIYNPTAGGGRAAKVLPKIQALLSDYGFQYDLVFTESIGHAEKIARQAVEEGRELVVSAGGDGTFNETLNGLMHASANGSSRPALGVLPVGRGNDFAFSMGIPMDIPQACETLAQQRKRTIDIGLVTGGNFPEGRFFGNGVGLGFDTVVGFEAAKMRWLGAGSYLVGVVKTIFLYAHAPIYEIEYDGETHRQPYLLVSIMNGRRMGGAFMMAPQSDPGDGSFDLCMAGQVPQSRILFVAAKFISGTQAQHPAVKMDRARKISVRAVNGTIPAHADGETVCEAGQFISVEMIPGALQLVTRLPQTGALPR
jgi:diacylglycerol kinase (ATP)